MNIIHGEIEILKNYDIDKIDIWEIQKILKDNECVEIDFGSPLDIIITRDEIYIRRFEEFILNIDIPMFPGAYEFDRDKYIHYGHIYVPDNFSYEEQEKIIKNILKKCKYRLIDHWE